MLAGDADRDGVVHGAITHELLIYGCIREVEGVAEYPDSERLTLPLFLEGPPALIL